MFGPVVRILFGQRKWTVSSPEICVFHKDNFKLNTTYGVVMLSDKSFSALQPFVQIVQVLRNIHHKGKVLHLLWDEILTKIKHFATPPIFGLATPLVAWKKILVDW